MRMKYFLSQIPLKQQYRLSGQLIKYYGKRKYQINEMIEEIKGSSTLVKKLVEQVKKHTGDTSFSTSQFKTGIDTAGNIDLFSMKINDIDVAKLFTKKDLEIEMYESPIIFTTSAMLKYGLNPLNIRNKKLADIKIKRNIVKAQNDFVKDFEKDLRTYHQEKLWKKNIINE